MALPGSDANASTSKRVRGGSNQTRDECAQVQCSEPRHPLLIDMGERARRFRANRGLARKRVAYLARVSERRLGSLERGSGNVSVLFLQQLANALQCS
ncbi:MAG: helix-turn-helix domain-containing protein [Proteobacteria bacterium]|nr:helix-turn-helix domain-containing protein [Pseudomonadota bacterium]